MEKKQVKKTASKSNSDTHNNDRISLATPPEPGQLVEVRRRQWIVSDVDVSAVSPERPRRSLVKLASIDEDALGEEIEVVWEIEPGAHVIERSGLPSLSGFDDPEKLEAFLDAVRWGAATNADRGYLQAPFRSGISIEDYQLDPLVRAIDMARTNLLIADDVGLGKTIEAGLVIQEMLVRHRARTILILCPSSLQEKWRVEMIEKFGLEFRIVDSGYVKNLRREQGLHANPWTSFPRLIASIDWAKQGEGIRLLRDVLPPRHTLPRRFDLLVIDEAHNVSPNFKNHAVESLRTRLVRLIAPHFQHKLFLTATPHDGFTESFTALLELLDDQRFSRSVMPSEEQLARVMIRRLKSELVDAEGRHLYPTRQLNALAVEVTQDERDARSLLDTYISSRENTNEHKGYSSRFVHQLLRKRFASSPAAFAATLERHVTTVETGTSQRRPATDLDERILRRAIAKVDEDYALDDMREEVEGKAMEEASRRMKPFSEDERKLVNKLRSWAQQVRTRPDSKAKALIAWLNEYIRQDGKWNNGRVVLFTEYRATQTWLHEILASHGFAGDRLALIYGGMDTKERDAVKAAFQAHPKDSPLRILLATDAASEGIDLQNYCNLLVHIEIPYNPNVMEQRNGRIDRHGQKNSEVVIWHPTDSSGNHGEDIIRALKKLDSMRADMGSVNPVIAPQIPDLLEGRSRFLDTSSAERRMQQARKFVKIEREIKKRVSKLHERLMLTKSELNLTPDRIENTVRVALRLAQKPDLSPATIEGVDGPNAFQVPDLSGSWLKCRDGLEHPYTKKIRPITFDHEVAKGRDDVVLVHLNHPLVQKSLRLLRAEIWARDDVKKMHRVSARTLPDSQLGSIALVLVSRLVITGGNHHRLHEELTEVGGYLRDGAFKREEHIKVVSEWMDEAKPSAMPNALFDDLRSTFSKHEASIVKSAEARSKDRLTFLSNAIETRKIREIEDMTKTLDELKNHLEEELKKAMAPYQPSLFEEDEYTQLRRDRRAVEARLHQIPDELAKEVSIIEKRYSQLNALTFPVALIFLIPESVIQRAAK